MGSLIIDGVWKGNVTVLIPTKSPSVENATQYTCTAQQNLEMIIYNISDPFDANVRNIWEITTQKFVEFFYNNNFDSSTESGVYSITDSSVKLVEQNFLDDYMIDMLPILPSIILTYKHEGEFITDNPCENSFPAFSYPFSQPNKRQSYIAMLKNRRTDTQSFERITGVGEVIKVGSTPNQVSNSIPNIYITFFPMLKPLKYSESLMLFMSMKEFVESYYKTNNSTGGQRLSKLITVPFWKDGNSSQDSQSIHMDTFGQAELTIALQQFFSYEINFGRLDLFELAQTPLTSTGNENPFLSMLKKQSEQSLNLFADVTKMTVSFHTNVTNDSWGKFNIDLDTYTDVASDYMKGTHKNSIALFSVVLVCAIIIFITSYISFYRKKMKSSAFNVTLAKGSQESTIANYEISN